MRTYPLDYTASHPRKRTDWSRGNVLHLYSVRISFAIPAIVTKVLRDVPHSLEANVGMFV
jgi:hypothetical protein